MPSKLAALCLTALALVGTGCTAATSSAPPARRTAGGAGAYPLEAVLPSPAQDRLITRATDRLARQCLHRYGFEVDAPVISAGSGLVTQIHARRDDGLVTVAQARARGFHPASAGVPQRTARLAAKSPVWDVLNGWWRDEERTDAGPRAPRRYHGQPIEKFGCAGEAEDRLSQGASRPVVGRSPGGALDAVNYVLLLRKQVGDRVARDPRVRRVTHAWAACFTRRTGGHAENPVELGRRPRWQSPGGPTRVELRLAVASARCQRRVAYAGVVASRRASYERRVYARHRSTLGALTTFFQTRARTAAGVVG